MLLKEKKTGKQNTNGKLDNTCINVNIVKDP